MYFSVSQLALEKIPMLFCVTINYGIKRHMKLTVTHKEQSDWSAMNEALGTKVECAADLSFFPSACEKIAWARK